MVKEAVYYVFRFNKGCQTKQHLSAKFCFCSRLENVGFKVVYQAQFLGLVPLLTEDTGKTLTDFNKISPKILKEVFCED